MRYCCVNANCLISSIHILFIATVLLYSDLRRNHKRVTGVDEQLTQQQYEVLEAPSLLTYLQRACEHFAQHSKGFVRIGLNVFVP
jgi:hypothetical protein